MSGNVTRQQGDVGGNPFFTVLNNAGKSWMFETPTGDDAHMWEMCVQQCMHVLNTRMGNAIVVPSRGCTLLCQLQSDMHDSNDVIRVEGQYKSGLHR